MTAFGLLVQIIPSPAISPKDGLSPGLCPLQSALLCWESVIQGAGGGGMIFWAGGWCVLPSAPALLEQHMSALSCWCRRYLLKPATCWNRGHC